MYEKRKIFISIVICKTQCAWDHQVEIRKFYSRYFKGNFSLANLKCSCGRISFTFSLSPFEIVFLSFGLVDLNWSFSCDPSRLSVSVTLEELVWVTLKRFYENRGKVLRTFLGGFVNAAWYLRTEHPRDSSAYLSEYSIWNKTGLDCPSE